MSAETGLAPILGLGDSWPELVWVGRNATFYLCNVRAGIVGLVVCSTEANLSACMAEAGEQHEAVSMTFDEARELALSRRTLMHCLWLMDDPANPKQHWLV